ncbi:RidA family protein [Desulfocurvus sp.]|jgi:2-iminobutanoate/2-iminopropanoate deaminase|uniref:RidA family protein n=1 Tax=Desulfocurvus sp. TaxID=2871698 RepID=UPI0025C28537|nr:RidA family protein [Desulfocurvus sp.]MCK9238792.1 RidA family protein [Desulfocurvus sp.]
MSAKQAICTQGAPAAIGPYSQAVVAGNFLFASGQLPIDPDTGTLLDAGIEDRARQVFRNLDAVARAAGCSLAHAVKTTVFLTDLADFKAVNAVYAEFFGQPHPARSAIQVAALPLGSNIEVEAIFTLGR